jgi:chromate transporter
MREAEHSGALVEPGAVRFGEALRVWLFIGLTGFGGPAGQIALMHRVLVDEKRWIDERRYLHALNYCMLLPGPEAQQLATYVGWLLHGTRGGLVAGTLFVLPGALVVFALSFAYVTLATLPLVEGLFLGVKAAVLALVVEALLRIGRRVLKTRASYSVAAAAFIAIFVFEVPFPLIILAAGLIGALSLRLKGPSATGAGAGELAHAGPAADAALSVARPSALKSLGTALLWLSLWLAPVAALHLALGADHVMSALARFFSFLAVVTFGGAYAVLAYMAQAAVETYGWLSPQEMLDGLGLAETTPGPLILVTEFVGFLAAYRDPGALPPIASAALGSALVLWVTFVLSFLWIFLGAPYVERMRSVGAFASALEAITAAVVGVILNLSLWFALHALFAQVREAQALGARLLMPALDSLNGPALALTALAFVALFALRLGTLGTLALAAALGAGYALFLI